MGVRVKPFNRKLNPGVYERPDGRYQAHIAIPRDVQFAFVTESGHPLKKRVVSLRTHDPETANREHARLVASYAGLFEAVRTGAVAPAFQEFLTELYAAQLEQQGRFEDMVATNRLRANPYLDPIHARALESDDPEERIATAGWAVDWFMLTRSGLANAEITSAMRRSVAYRSMAWRCADVLRDAWRSGDQQRKGQIISLPQHVPNSFRAAESDDGNRALDVRGKLPITRYLTEVFLPAVAASGGVTPHTSALKVDAHTLFAELIGDKPVYLIRRADMIDFQAQLRAFPNRSKLSGAESKLSVSELVGAHKAGTLKGAFRLGAETINKNVRALKATLNAAKQQGHIRFSPAEDLPDIRPTASNPAIERRSFTRAELTSIFSQPLFVGCQNDSQAGVLRPGNQLVRDERFWIPLLLFLTGARSTEIAGLEIKDIIVDGMASRILIRPNGIRRLKNEWSARIIPIHSWAFDLGFAEFMKERGSVGRSLFPMIDAARGTGELTEGSLTSMPIMRQFYRTILKKAGVVRGETSTHSFRHTYEEAMTFSVADSEIRARLTGRAIDGSRGEYTKRLFTDEHMQRDYAMGLRAAVDKIDFWKLDLSSLVRTPVEE